MSKMFYYDPNKYSYQPVYAQALNFNNDILSAEEIINKINQAGKVDSVNGQQGKVELVAKDIPMNQWSSITIEDMLSRLDDNVATLNTNKADKNYVDDEVNEIEFLAWDLWAELNADKADRTELDYKADKNYVDTQIGKVPKTLHDKPTGAVTEDKTPSWFDVGVTICNQNNKNQFPSIGEFGVSLTFKGEDRNFGQIFITVDGDIWSRRSNGSFSWRDWYSNKKEIDNLKQSGVESNRILVDALNSKGVWASTSSTIKTNVNKVKDIMTPPDFLPNTTQWLNDFEIIDKADGVNILPNGAIYKPKTATHLGGIRGIILLKHLKHSDDDRYTKEYQVLTFTKDGFTHVIHSNNTDKPNFAPLPPPDFWKHKAFEVEHTILTEYRLDQLMSINGVGEAYIYITPICKTY